MKIETRLSKAAPKGWISPADVHASIVLANLYGTPASDRRLTGKVELEPAAFSFSEFPEFTFFDPMLDEKKTRSEQTDRKSTRLNSSHVEISYAVFCLKK